MKRTTCVLLLLSLLSCNGPREHVQFLWKDAEYAERAGNIKRPELRGATLLLRNPGELRYFAAAGNNGTLRFKSRCAEGLVRIERDAPSPLIQEYRAQDSEEQAVPLGSFEGSALRVSFSGPCEWENPRIEYTQVLLPRIKHEQFENRRFNFLILILDAAGASHFGSYGYNKPTTPHMDAFAKQSVLFEQAYTVAPFTISSTGTLFTGLYPLTHQVILREHVLKPGVRTLAETFRGAQYETGFFVGNPNASELFGFDRGFTHRERIYKGVPVAAEEIVEPLLRWLNTVQHKPFFGYVHFREPHAPYEPPAGFLERFPVNPDAGIKEKTTAAYDAGLAYVDSQVRRVLAHLTELGLDQNTVILISADHGEELWEHGKIGHHTQLYEESLRIPFLFHVPGDPSLRGKRVSEPVSNVDLMPTILDLFGLSRKGVRTQGHSLLPALYGSRLAPERKFLALSNTRKAYSLRWHNWKYIHFEQWKQKSSDELFDLSNDPAEQNNVIGDFPITSTFLRIELDRMRRNTQSRDLPMKREGNIDPQIEEELKALGYLD